jgi:hypothetical protein
LCSAEKEASKGGVILSTPAPVEITNWAAIGAIAGCVYTFAFIASIGVLVSQLRAQVRQLRAQSFAEVYERIQAEEVRKAREKLYELDESRAAFSEWRNDNSTLEAVENVCQRYDYFAKMVRYKFLSKNDILRSWAWQVVRLWRVAKPYVEARRRNLPGQLRLWEDFEWLASVSDKWESEHQSPISARFRGGS